MPLYILVPMILVGLPLVIGLVYLTTKREHQPALDETLAISRFKEDYPNCTISNVILSDDGANAFLLIEGEERIGLVAGVGKNYLTRMIGSENVRNLTDNDDQIELVLDDFTLRRLSVKIAVETKRQKIFEKLT